MAGIVEYEGPARPDDRRRVPREALTPEAEMAEVLRALRVVGMSRDVMDEAAARMRADPAHGSAWATWKLSERPRRDSGPLCRCGAELTDAGWQGEATIRCGDCGSRWHVTASGGWTGAWGITRPSDEWLDQHRPLDEATGPGADPGQPDARPPFPPQLHPDLEEVLSPLLADLAATCAVQPTVDPWESEDDAHPLAMLWGPDRGGQIVSVGFGETHAERLASTAETVQEWAVEALWGAGLPATWPECPGHPDSHPLEPTVADDTALWVCPVSHRPVAGIGLLGSAEPGHAPP